MSLVEKIRRAREQVVEVGGHRFTVRRPTDLEMIEARGEFRPRWGLQFVVDWQDVTEADIIPGGSPVAVPFDVALCAEWLADRPDLMTPLVEAALRAYTAHADALEAARKN